MNGLTTLERFRTFTAPGPVAEAYVADVEHQVQLIRGPVGSGKTVSSIYKTLNIATRIMPVCRDGVIHCKLAVGGITYGQLERNLYPTWQYWLPKDGTYNDGPAWFEGEWEGGRGRFAEHKLQFETIRRSRRFLVDFHVVFAAIGELSVEEFVRGFEPSIWYLYEVDQLKDGIIEQAVGRLGRFPNRDMLPDGATWRGLVIGDTNSGETDGWYHRTVEEQKPTGWKQYVQPAGDSPMAENIANLPPSYYENLKTLNGHKPKWVRRFVKNRYGPSGDGDPVYDATYSPERHVAPEELRAVKGRPIVVGMDQGVRPAAVIYQPMSNGQRRVLGEVYNYVMSPRRFADALLAEIAIVAPNCPIAGMWADPAGFDGKDKEDSGSLAWAEQVFVELMDHIPDPILPADTNDPDVCIPAIEDRLVYMVSAEEPALLISPRCRWLIKALGSEYKFEKRPENKSQIRRPIKNHHANVVNALQYGLVGELGRQGVISGPRDPREEARIAMLAGRDGHSGAGKGDQALKAPIDLG